MQTTENKVFNILHITTKLPVGGVENMILKVVKGYNKQRFNLIIGCIKEGGEIADELKRSGFRVEILNKMQGHGFDYSAVKAIYDLIKRENIHILRTHQYHANLYGRIAGALAKVPVIIPSTHNIYVYRGRSKLHRKFFNYILSFFSDKVVAVSDTVASDIARHDKVNSEKIRVIYNGIELYKFNDGLSKNEAKDFFGLPHNVLMIGSIGRLTDQKGHQYLIEAASKLENSCVVIAGDGPLMKELKELSRRLNVNCIFMGKLNPENVPIALRAFDIFCFPSLWEGMPSTLIEAMATGLPVVASDIPQHREVLGSTGMFTPSGDSIKLAEALEILVSDFSLRETLGKKARERAKLFSIENTVRAYEDLFNEVIKKKGLL